MYALQLLLQFLIIFFAVGAMYLLNRAKGIEANNSRVVGQIGGTLRERVRLCLNDWSFTNKWGHRSFVIAICLLLANLAVSYLRTKHH